MADVLTMRAVPNMHPPSPTSSATYVDCPSPSPKAGHTKVPRYHMNHTNIKGDYKEAESHLFRQSPMSPSPMPPPADRAEGAEGRYNIAPTTLLSLAPELLNNTDVPLDLLKEGISAQYATCEKYRNHMVTTLWRLEEAKRWSRFLQHTLIILQKDHKAAQSGLKCWVELAEKQITEEASSSSDTAAPHETLGLVQTDYNNLEGLAIARGLTDEDFNLGLELADELADEDFIPDEDMCMKDDEEHSVGY